MPVSLLRARGSRLTIFSPRIATATKGVRSCMRQLARNHSGDAKARLQNETFTSLSHSERISSISDSVEYTRHSTHAAFKVLLDSRVRVSGFKSCSCSVTTLCSLINMASDASHKFKMTNLLYSWLPIALILLDLPVPAS